MVRTKSTPARPAPLSETTLLGWLKKNLFSSIFNTVLTFVTLFIIYLTVKGLWVWGIADAVWIAETRRECFDKSIDGACWAGVISWMDNIFYGRYPKDELWRVNLGILLLIVWMLPLWLPRVKGKVLIAITLIAFYPFLANYLFLGGESGLLRQVMISAALVSFVIIILNAVIGVTRGQSFSEFIIKSVGKTLQSEKSQRNLVLAILVIGFVISFLWQRTWDLGEVPWTKWGGLFLTLVIAGIGIASALPGGIILALGRRSKLPVIKVLSTAFIEVFRSVPLITVLFMATTMFPLFLPEGYVLNKLTQVIIAVCLFNAAYMAETVRGGLQTIPKGQYEGAHTVGLGYWGTMGLIVMPQALKNMIPNIVGSFISILKDTTLVSIIGLFDILGMLTTISRDLPWIGLHKEPLLFGAMIFFILCALMSKYSRHLEAKLATGHKT
jgi:general L-amino acid transport system permease protein